MLQHPLLCHQPLPEPILPPSTLHLAAHTLLSLQLPHPALSPGSSQRSACPALPSPPDTVHVGSGLFCCCSLLLGPALGKWGWLLLLEYKVTALRSILPSPCPALLSPTLGNVALQGQQGRTPRLAVPNSSDTAMWQHGDVHEQNLLQKLSTALNTSHSCGTRAVPGHFQNTSRTSRTLAGSLALPGWRWLPWSRNASGNLGHQSGPRDAQGSPCSALRGRSSGQGQWPWARWLLSPMSFLLTQKPRANRGP